ncbi:MAG: AraC family transcriptional regulator [Acetobacteraceae bacterium]|nr:AraC family transcriptional regulator [Acetobacteraceae bacterium]
MPLRVTTLTDHARRIARAMARLAEDPSRAPSLDELASVAAYSPHHFHRAYHALTGETPAQTLARLRLSHAAAALAKTDAPLAAVARQVGFGSVAAFNRAFRAAYGIPPGAYRARVADRREALSEETTMDDVRITDLPPLRLAALNHRGPYDGIGAAFDRLNAWAAARGLLRPETRFFALYLDDPRTVPPAELRAQAGLTVPADCVPEGGPRLLEVPALRCARLRHQGPYAELEDAYDRLYGAWLPESGEDPADHPCLEEYLNDPRALPPGEWLTDVFLPLRARVAA